MENSLAISQLNLLLKVNWHLSDIKEYFGCGDSSAFKTRQEAIVRYNGKVKFESKKVSARAVLKVKGLDYDEEIKIRKELLL